MGRVHGRDVPHARASATPIPQVTSAPGWTLVLLDADSEEFYRSVFRVVPADTLFAQFASDRSHMVSVSVCYFESVSALRATSSCR